VLLGEEQLGTAGAASNGQDGAGALPYIIRDGRRMTPFLAVSIRDTGIGIAQKHIEMIFEEFRQVHAGHSGRRGSGLGLAITRRLIEAHGGRIWVESAPGQGSIFTFMLPLSAAPERSQPAAAPPTLAGEAHPGEQRSVVEAQTRL
jgi:two-component system sensor histidine kinase/response regulator